MFSSKWSTITFPDLKSDWFFSPEDRTDSLAKTLREVAMTADVQVVCIGTDRCTGDALGPLVGTFLTEKRFPSPVIGTVEFPVHACNISEAIEMLDSKRLTLAIDTCLTTPSRVGLVKVQNGPIKPGTGVGKDRLPPIGDLSVLGLVAPLGTSYSTLLETRLSLVWNMARYISDQIYKAFTKR